MSNFKIKTREKKNDRVRDGLANLTTVHITQSINQLAETKKDEPKQKKLAETKKASRNKKN